MQATLPERVASSALAPAVEARLRDYAALLSRWTRRINLIARGDEAALWERHVLDSLRLAPLLPEGLERAIDLGSGGGLPGLVLAIATGVNFELIESDRRKAAFLQEAARITAAPVTVHCSRIERVALAPAPLVTARALAPLDALLGLAAPLLAPGGVLLLPKGARAAEEIDTARQSWSFVLERIGPPASPILRIAAPRRRHDG